MKKSTKPEDTIAEHSEEACSYVSRSDMKNINRECKSEDREDTRGKREDRKADYEIE